MNRVRLESGFTLMEALVVLVITSLAVGVMFQMLSGYRIARERISAQASGLGRDALFRGWFMDSVHGLIPVEAAPLEGGPERFEGTTLNPLVAPAGAPARVEWTLGADESGMWTVRYKEDGVEQWSLPLKGSARPHFAYYTEDGRETRTWPPESGVQAPLPSSVVLVQDDRVGVASVLGPLEPRVDPWELEQE